jgi:hypothetical protein
MLCAQRHETTGERRYGLLMDSFTFSEDIRFQNFGNI